MVERQEVHTKIRWPELLLIVFYMAVSLTFGASLITNRGPDQYGTCFATQYSGYHSNMHRPYQQESVFTGIYEDGFRQPVVLKLFGSRFVIILNP